MPSRETLVAVAATATATAMFAMCVLSCSSSEGSEGKAGKAGKGAAKKRGPRPALVKLAPVGASQLTDRWAFLGQVKSAMSASIAAAVPGHLRKLDVRTGDKITKGQVLIKLDPTRVGAQVAASRAKEARFVAELAQAKRLLNRLKKMKSSAFSEPEREKFELDVKSLTAQLAARRAETRQAQTEYWQHIIKAPFDAVVSARHFNPGAWVNTGQAIIDIISLSQLEVFVDIAPELGRRLKVGGKATLKGSPDVPATIAGIVPALNASTRGMRIRLTPDKRAPWVMSGSTVNVEFTVDLTGKGVTVPTDALVRGPVSVRVIKAVANKGVPIEVTIVATSGKTSLVTGKGLAAGDNVVVRGNQRLRPGQPLKVIK